MASGWKTAGKSRFCKTGAQDSADREVGQTVKALEEPLTTNPAAVYLESLSRSLPPGCELRRLSYTRGSADSSGLGDVADKLQEDIQGLDGEVNTLILNGCTACGKTKVAPSVACRVGSTLVVTPVRVDVPSIAERASVPAYWQIGGGE